MTNHKGFALIELIAVIVLVGIIASFSAFFLYTGFNGYMNTKKATEGALNAQMALDRIALELQDISDGIAFVENTSVSYKSEELTGTRTLKYDSNSKTIQITVNNTNYNLLENVPTTSFELSVNCQDLDNDGNADDIANIDVRFQIGEIGKDFKTRIFPRNMAQCPP